jgi:rubrerythrin
MMAKSAAMRMNRTASSLAPDLAVAMEEAVQEFPPSSDGDARAVAAIRIAYAKSAEPIGSMPPPPSMKEFARTAVRAAQGKQPLLFLDKLGERLAFERSGTRLYEAVLSKFDSHGGFRGGPSRRDLEHICEEELSHFMMLSLAIQQLGGDPTAVTPSASLHATIAMGLPQVVTDPRTDLAQCLEAALVAELADNACWEALIELARMGGETELAEQFTEALGHEREHLERVRAWIAAHQGRRGAPAALTAMPSGPRTAQSRPRKPAGRSSRRRTSTRQRRRPVRGKTYT